jgi:hypothetical protein
MRTSESKARWQIIAYSAVFGFEVPVPVCRKIAGTSNPPH